MEHRFKISTGISSPDLRENLIESIRLQARQQGMRATVAPEGQDLRITLECTDRGTIIAMEAAIKSWVERQTQIS